MDILFLLPICLNFLTINIFKLEAMVTSPNFALSARLSHSTENKCDAAQKSLECRMGSYKAKSEIKSKKQGGGTEIRPILLARIALLSLNKTAVFTKKSLKLYNGDCNARHF